MLLRLNAVKIYQEFSTDNIFSQALLLSQIVFCGTVIRKKKKIKIMKLSVLHKYERAKPFLVRSS